MSILNKILEEIEERLNMVENIPINEDDDFLDCEECYETGSVQGRFEELLWCRNIIRSHMGEVAEDWVPVEERLPEESLNSVIGWDEHRERCVFVQFWNGRWIFGNDIEPVLITAWQPLPEPYKPKKDNSATEHIMSRFTKVE